MVTVLLATGAGVADARETRVLTVLEQATYCGDEQAGARWLERDGEPALLLSMGQRPSGGFGISLADPEAELVDGVWEVQVQWREPAPGEPVTLALTLPCLKLAGGWSAPVAVRVIDQSGRVRLEAGGDPLK